MSACDAIYIRFKLKFLRVGVRFQLVFGFMFRFWFRFFFFSGPVSVWVPLGRDSVRFGSGLFYMFRVRFRFRYNGIRCRIWFRCRIRFEIRFRFGIW